MELFERIRQDHREEGCPSVPWPVATGSIGAPCARPWPRRGHRPVGCLPASPGPGPLEGHHRCLAGADLAAPRKQRHTARRVWQRLLDEHGAVVAESTVRAYVARSAVSS